MQGGNILSVFIHDPWSDTIIAGPFHYQQTMIPFQTYQNLRLVPIPGFSLMEGTPNIIMWRNVGGIVIQPYIDT